ncbi:MAG: serine/threonine-protein kinase [Acidimicrobiia bacterium]
MASLLERLREALAPQYEVERELASGGMGRVFLANDTMLDRLVAVKVLRPEAASPIAAKRFLQEARILARLSHPNVVPVHQAGEMGESFYYIMDYVEGETLEECLERGPLPMQRVVQIGNDLLAALQEIHEHGVVHRDVKPSNVFLAGERVLLGDFGIAKRIETSSPPLTESGGFRIGTPGYMAPEQVDGAEVTPVTDIYALGMVLYEALTGRKWSILTPSSVWPHTVGRLARRSRKNGEIWSGVPRRLRHALRTALEWAPKDRWPDAAAFRRAL